MGLIADFMGGAGDAAAFWGKTEITKQAAMERDEANALRKASLDRELQDDRQDFTSREAKTQRGFTTSEREASSVTKEAENARKRKSDEKIAGLKVTSDKSDRALNAARTRWAKREEEISEMVSEKDPITGELLYAKEDIEAARSTNLDIYYDQMSMDGKRPAEDPAPKKAGGKDSQAYYDFLKKKYPGRSDEDINTRVKSKFSDWPGVSAQPAVKPPEIQAPGGEPSKGIIGDKGSKTPELPAAPSKRPSVVKKGPLDVSGRGEKGSGIFSTMGEAVVKQSPNRLDAVRTAISAGDARTLRAMDFKAITEISKQLTPQERERLGKLLGLVQM